MALFSEKNESSSHTAESMFTTQWDSVPPEVQTWRVSVAWGPCRGATASPTLQASGHCRCLLPRREQHGAECLAELFVSRTAVNDANVK